MYICMYVYMYTHIHIIGMFWTWNSEVAPAADVPAHELPHPAPAIPATRPVGGWVWVVGFLGAIRFRVWSLGLGSGFGAASTQ